MQRYTIPQKYRQLLTILRGRHGYQCTNLPLFSDCNKWMGTVPLIHFELHKLMPTVIRQKKNKVLQFFARWLHGYSCNRNRRGKTEVCQKKKIAKTFNLLTWHASSPLCIVV